MISFITIVLSLVVVSCAFAMSSNGNTKLSGNADAIQQWFKVLRLRIYAMAVIAVAAVIAIVILNHP